MIPKMDPELFQKMMADPEALLTALIDFQTATLEAAQVIAENNVAAFQELASKTSADPQSAAQAQPAVLKQTYEKNMAVINTLWQSIGNVAPEPKKKGK